MYSAALALVHRLSCQESGQDAPERCPGKCPLVSRFACLLSTSGSLSLSVVYYAHSRPWRLDTIATFEKGEHRRQDSFSLSHGESRDNYCPVRYLTTTDQQIKLLLSSRTGSVMRMMRSLIITSKERRKEKRSKLRKQRVRELE